MSITSRWQSSGVLDLVDGFEQVMREPIVANRPAVALDVGILLWLCRLDEINANAALFSPYQRDGVDVLRAIVVTDRID